ncbi:motility associated factor glycosyltransferase family protein [Motilimonas eburnea]|uniref:motility associated factor glycosyltransferase family protein n=1 Tax=Motilimonas eburnea TaxID=1737488 RepID=UPI001E6529EC|nr:6-hydroxymethylpterin diphosphokinase MptE-like protein [Motilimonas eburnea]MCE2571546.1 DUF115 domain-containing protein [Motilimonas eburnea]
MSDLPAASKIETIKQDILQAVSQLPYHHKDYQTQFAINISAFEDYIPDIAQAFKYYEPESFELVATEASVDLVQKGSDVLTFGGDAYRSCLFDFELYKRQPDSSNMLVNKSFQTSGFLHYEYLNKLVELQNRELEFAESFFPESLGLMICFGLGTGFYLENLISNHQVNRLYIYEPNHDFFYASLHLIDWKSILEKLDEMGSSLHFCLGANEQAFFADLTKELTYKGGYDIGKSYLYKHYDSDVINKACEVYKQRSYELAFGFGFFDDGLIATAHHYYNLKDIPVIEDKPAFQNNANIPVFLCGNGPSLDKNIALIKAQQSKAIVISCGTAIDSLLKNGIVPDMHVEQERTWQVTERLLTVDPKVLKEMVLLSMNTVSPEAFALFDRKIMGLKLNEPPTSLTYSMSEEAKKMKGILYCNPTVANTALCIVEALGFKNIYFIGIDLGFPNGQHHSIDSVYYENGEDRKVFHQKSQDKIEVKGNFGGTVRSSYIFGFSLKALERVIADNVSLNCFNLSDGALIEGAKPLEPHELVLSGTELDKGKVINSTLEYYQFDASAFATMFKEKLVELDFCHYIDQLIAFTLRPLTTRQEAITNLYQQYVFAESGGEINSLFLKDMVRGSLLYTHTVLSRLLQSQVDVEKTLAVHQEGLAILRDYLEGMKQKFSEQLLVPDKTKFPFQFLKTK